jgi:hypothetical protein
MAMTIRRMEERMRREQERAERAEAALRELRASQALVMNEQYRQAELDVTLANRDVGQESRKVRLALDQIDVAISRDLAVPQGVTGEPFIANNVGRLVSALRAREAAYRKQHDLAYIAERLGVKLEARS